MGAQTGIEWTDATWNPIRARITNRDVAVRKPVGSLGWHCEHVSEGCRNCYAETINRRLGTGLDFKPGHRDDIEIFLDERMLTAPLRWREPKHIFVNSMTDIGAYFVTDAMLDKIFAVMALAPRHTFQILTKRPERMREYCTTIQKHGRWLAMEDIALGLGFAPRGADNDGFDWLAHKQMLPNVWLGTSCEDQDAWDTRVQHLGATPAAVRFVSYEPALGPIDAGNAFDDESDEYRPIDWVICGGESGPHARPMHPDWARSMRDQCAAAGVKFFFKQWGAWQAGSTLGKHPKLDAAVCDDGRIIRPATKGNLEAAESVKPIWNHHPEMMARVGKKAAGRLLDGREHNEMPEVRS